MTLCDCSNSHGFSADCRRTTSPLGWSRYITPFPSHILLCVVVIVHRFSTFMIGSTWLQFKSICSLTHGLVVTVQIATDSQQIVEGQQRSLGQSRFTSIPFLNNCVSPFFDRFFHADDWVDMVADQIELFVDPRTRGETVRLYRMLTKSGRMVPCVFMRCVLATCVSFFCRFVSTRQAIFSRFIELRI